MIDNLINTSLERTDRMAADRNHMDNRTVKISNLINALYDETEGDYDAHLLVDDLRCELSNVLAVAGLCDQDTFNNLARTRRSEG